MYLIYTTPQIINKQNDKKYKQATKKKLQKNWIELIWCDFKFCFLFGVLQAVCA